MIYRQFESSEEATRFFDWLLKIEEFHDFNWTVHELVTLSKDPGRFCHWYRKKAGDGTQAMELQLHYVDKQHYSECLTADLMIAAGEMIHKECRLIDVPAAPAKKNWVCYDAYSNGRVNEHGTKGVISKVLSK
jgi:hypothetical protein